MAEGNQGSSASEEATDFTSDADFTRRALIALGAVGIGALALTGCSALTAFNRLVPKDRGSTRLAFDTPYGDDPRQRLDVYAPVGATGPLPVIVFFYGGSWNSGSKDGYAWLGRAIAAQGFIAVLPDYRLFPDVRYPGFLDDSAAAIRWVIASAEGFGGDPTRIVVSGHSAGAYNAAMLALDNKRLGEDRSAIRGLIGLAGPFDFSLRDGPIIRQTFGAWPDFPETQPITYAGAGDPPAFLATAVGDRTVREYNSNNLAAKLRAAGVEVERKRYSGVGHVGIVTAIAKPLRGRASVLDDMTAFARRVVA